MARFNIFENKGGSGYRLDVQTDLLSGLNTRVGKKSGVGLINAGFRLKASAPPLLQKRPQRIAGLVDG